MTALCVGTTWLGRKPIPVLITKETNVWIQPMADWCQALLNFSENWSPLPSNTPTAKKAAQQEVASSTVRLCTMPPGREDLPQAIGNSPQGFLPVCTGRIPTAPSSSIRVTAGLATAKRGRMRVLRNDCGATAGNSQVREG